jgi:hypothetical protein
MELGLRLFDERETIIKLSRKRRGMGDVIPAIESLNTFHYPGSGVEVCPLL